jgi:YHS domain-containing protein
MQNEESSMTRKRLFCFALCILGCALLAACKAPAKGGAAPRAKKNAEMRTIDDITPRPVVHDPPPMLQEEAAPPRPLGAAWEVKQPVLLTPEDEKLRASLPFAPAIGMDPVDGSKISILARTPTIEYKGHIYYFSSEENKKTFLANPEQFIKGSFSRL